MVDKEKYLGESKLIEQPNKKLKLLIGDGAVTLDKINKDIIDDVPKKGSKNLARSGGIFDVIDAINPAVYNDCTFNNATDGIDITEVEVSGGRVLRLANRLATDGLGYKIIRRKDGARNDLTFEEQLGPSYTIYEVRNDFIVTEEEITFPTGSVLYFNGGSLSNPDGTTRIIGDKAVFSSFVPKDRTLNNVELVEDWSYYQAEQVQADWEQTNEEAPDYIKNKPEISDFINREYNPSEYSGLGKVYLKKNIVNVGGTNKNILTQDAFCKDGPNDTRVPNTNTIFVVPFDFEVGGKRTVSVTINVSDSNYSNLVNPNYTANVEVYNTLSTKYAAQYATELALQAEYDALVERSAPEEEIAAALDALNKQQQKVATALNKKNDQEIIKNNTPHYYYCTKVTIPAHKVLHATCPGCVFLAYDETLSTIISKDSCYGSTIDGVDIAVYVAYCIPSNHEPSITYNFVEDTFISLPENSVLEFDGGSIKSGTIQGNSSSIIASPNNEIFKDNIIIKGIWNIAEIYDGWFKYNYSANTANNQIIHNILGLTHDDYSSNVHITQDRVYLVELPTIPLVLKNGYNVSCRQYNRSSQYCPEATASAPREDIRVSHWGWGPGLDAITIFKLTSNTRYIIDSTIKMLPTGEDYYQMFNILKKENIVIEGSGSLIGDNTGIENTHLYSEYYNPSINTYFGEQGFIVRAYAVKNLAIRNLIFSGSFGDNILITGDNYDVETGLYYLNEEQNITPSNKVDLLNLRILYARRNGIAISCRNALVQGCFFEGNGIGEIKGTAPKAGIDFECDQCTMSLHSGPGKAIMCNRNVTMDGCVFRNNENDISSTGNRAWGEETIETFIKNCAFTAPLRLNSTNGLQFEDCYIPSIEGKHLANNAELWYLAQSENINFIRCFFEDTNIRMLTYTSFDSKYLVTDSIKFIDCIFKNDFKIADHAYVYAKATQMAYLRVTPPPQNSDYIINMRLTFSGYAKKSLADTDGYICLSSIEYTFRMLSTSTRMCKCKRIHARGSNVFSGDKDNDVHLPRVHIKNMDGYTYLFISSPYFKNYGLGVDYEINCCKLTNSASETAFVRFKVNPVVGVFDETEEINKNTVSFANPINDYIPGNYATQDGATSIISDARSPFFHNNRLLFPTGDSILGVDGELYNIRKSGSTSQRPTPTNVNFMYFDTSTHMPIWWDGEMYSYGDGVRVSTKRSGATSDRPTGRHTEYANPDDPTDTSLTPDSIHTEEINVGDLGAVSQQGFVYFDTTLGKPIYAKEINGTTGVITWVDATGATV